MWKIDWILKLTIFFSYFSKLSPASPDLVASKIINRSYRPVDLIKSLDA